jgi:hypothetical protein
VYKWEECKECKECKNLSVFEKIRIPTIYMRKQCHWFVTGTKESILCLIGSASNITGTDSWPWKELKENLEVNILAPKYICEKAVFYGSKETADFIKKLPGINSVYICEDKDKMYEYPPF